jgi:hypothetical protein
VNYALAFENHTTKDNAGVNGICQGLENMVLRADCDDVAGNESTARRLWLIPSYVTHSI